MFWGSKYKVVILLESFLQVAYTIQSSTLLKYIVVNIFVTPFMGEKKRDLGNNQINVFSKIVNNFFGMSLQ